MPLRLVSARPRTTLALILLFIFALTLPAMAGVNGAIYTTDSTGTTVNGNIYDAKGDVYLNGGPQNTKDKGLVPDGLYYFQVTDPSGATLLSSDDLDCRMVTVAGGRITGAAPAGPNCSTGAHANGTYNASNGETPVQLVPYNDTPNPGGEYKAWLTPKDAYNNCSSKNANKVFGFCDSDSKTDNFKIKTQGVATVTVCKFNDWDGNGSQNDGEPFLEHWPITATGVGADSGTVHTQTDDQGCVSFSVSKFGQDGTATVTLTEGSEGPDWTQTAPANGPCGDNCNVSNGVITLVVKADDKIAAPNFGNNNPYCSTGCFGNTLVVTKDANPSLTRTYTWGISKTVDQDQQNTTGSATFNYTVSVTHDTGTDSDWKVTGNIRVANPTGDDVTGINVSDAIDNGGTCVVAGGPNGDGTGITVEAGSHLDVPYTCTYSGAPAPAAGTNTATAAWGDGVQNGTAGYDFANAAVASVDDKATITDSLGGTLGTVSASDASPATFPYSETFTDPAGTCTTHPNTATFTTNTTSATGSDSKSVKVCVGADLTAGKTATPSFDSAISKTVDQSEIDTAGAATANYTVTVTESGWKVSGAVTVTNPNDWESVTANITDTPSGGACTIDGGGVLTLGPGATQAANYTCTFASAPAASGSNTASVTWDPASAYTTGNSASASANYHFGSLTVTDSMQGTLGTITDPTASTTYTYARTFNDAAGTCTTHNNTAALTETGQSASASVKVCVGADLSLSKTATPSFNSSIKKSVDKTQLEQADGTGTFNYTVTVSESGWQVAGTLTVTNPNDWEAVTVNAADALPGASCTIAGGGIVTVAAHSSSTLNYACAFSAAPAASGTNTASISWSGAFTPNSSATGSANYQFASLTVTDTYKGTLGTISSPAGTTTYTYSRTVNNAIGGQCVTYPNTASIVGGASSSQSVTMCNTNTGALTIGFWQNKNGQGIITASGPASGACTLGTWMRSNFAPFADLPSGSTCTQVATYVYNIIKAANASGASMNAMLKAQMLSTTLDVYFSTPSLGGNKIGAPTPIGSVNIDLTKVCNMIDSSSGTGTCGGSTSNASSAFGGASSMTVLNMLLFQNTVSNTGGTSWYGQNKSVQGLAKNAFDAINNRAALIAP